jgi:undecaprenyl-diphosphatase
MFWVSKTIIWIPLWLFFIYLLVVLYKRKAFPNILVLIGSVVLADLGSVYLFKNVFERLRPCHNPQIQDLVHLVNNHCGGQFGFVSSHAANMFAIASMMFLMIRHRYPKSYIPLFLWAALIGYSRIYLGVHYPGDVLFGALFGSLVAWLLWIVSRQFQFFRHS